MSQPYVGEIRMFGGNFAPAGWAFCDGRLLPISENDVLFVLIGTTYGGDGQETFALPDLRGRLPIHAGTGPGLSAYAQGQAAGTESVTLTLNQMPQHSHTLMASTTPATLPSPANAVPGTVNPTASSYSMYVVPGTSTMVPAPMAATSISPQGGSQPHENRMPALAVSFIISLFGIFPSQN
ncbi:phage tail protein [Sphingomonas sp. So64.6b]|uniref:phage tail protein n=1 Tax=Sphingomonas sp. So64.6b TaxID=2997354 RepID=UPI001600EC54|nr:tail fiber protein [Sphingomonas sp. So64.6b]QNA83314.1 phage tail protein [Sphingomonas sp. So64.6b]